MDSRVHADSLGVKSFNLKSFLSLFNSQALESSWAPCARSGTNGEGGIRSLRKLDKRFPEYFWKLSKIDSQAPARKSNPQAPVHLPQAIAVKERSHSSKISFDVFNGAENHKFTLKYEIYLRNSQLLRIFN